MSYLIQHSGKGTERMLVRKAWFVVKRPDGSLWELPTLGKRAYAKIRDSVRIGVRTGQLIEATMRHEMVALLPSQMPTMRMAQTWNRLDK